MRSGLVTRCNTGERIIMITGQRNFGEYNDTLFTNECNIERVDFQTEFQKRRELR